MALHETQVKFLLPQAEVLSVVTCLGGQYNTTQIGYLCRIPWLARSKAKCRAESNKIIDWLQTWPNWLCYADFNHSGAKCSIQTQTLNGTVLGMGGSRRWEMVGTWGWGHIWTLHPWANSLIIRSVYNNCHLLLRLVLKDKWLGGQDSYTEHKKGILNPCLLWQVPPITIFCHFLFSSCFILS